LFSLDSGKYTLRPLAREKLAKISGIVLAYPSLNLAIEGNTDSVGTEAFNQQLSEQRDNMGYTLSYANKMDLAKMTPPPGLSSTGFCLAQTPATGAEYLVYASNGGTFTVDLTAMPGNRSLNVAWLNPSTG
jgi:hypothetical protein